LVLKRGGTRSICYGPGVDPKQKAAAMVDNSETISEYLAKVTYFNSLGVSGKEKGTWSVWVTGNWRVTFEFDGPDAVAVDYRDYH